MAGERLVSFRESVLYSNEAFWVPHSVLVDSTILLLEAFVLLSVGIDDPVSLMESSRPEEVFYVSV